MKPAGLHELMSTAAEWAVFDVREAGEAEAGHIPGATFLPRRMVEFRITELVAAKDTPIVVYDEGGGRAALAAETLREFGYANVGVLDGGVAAWTADGMALVEGSNVPSKAFGEHLLSSERVPELTAEELAKWRDDGRDITICDIRTPEEHAAARIPDAWGVPSFDIALAVQDLADRGGPVVVHCAGRTRSIVACETLRRLGLRDVYALKNGTMGWMLAGHDLEKGKGRGVLVPSDKSRLAAERRAEALAREAGIGWVAVGELEAWMADREQGLRNLYVLDVRPLVDFVAGHIEGATALPGGQAVQRADEFISVRNAAIVFVDEDAARAAVTAYWYKRMGYPNVRVLRGGLHAWRVSGRPVVPGRGRPQPLGLPQRRAATRHVDAPTLADLLRSTPKVPVIDVDSSNHFAAAHLPGAQWLPRGWLEFRIGRIVPDKASPVVITCHDGVQSSFAAATLKRLGYHAVKVLDGGTAAWKHANLPVDTGLPEEVGDEPGDRVLPPYARGKAGMVRYLAWEEKLAEGK